MLELLLAAQRRHLVDERLGAVPEPPSGSGAAAQAGDNGGHLKYGWFDSQVNGIDGGDGDWAGDCDGEGFIWR